MANYNCAICTNYFHVKDENKFRDLMNRVYGSEGEIELYEEKDSSGETVFTFCLYGGIAGLRNAKADDDDADESSYDEFIDGLQECVSDNDAVIILEAGHEKLRYVIGSATVITSKGYRYMDISDIAIREAAAMLGNSKWETWY